MDFARITHFVEMAMDVMAAAVFAGAAAFAASALYGMDAIWAAPVIFMALFVILRQVPGSGKTYILPAFEPRPVERTTNGGQGSEELLLTSELIFEPQAARSCVEHASPEGELLLDQVLTRLEPESQVVRLFDPDSVPTAGELKANIDRHLGISQSGIELPDASQALSDALAQLRRSVR